MPEEQKWIEGHFVASKYGWDAEFEEALIIIAATPTTVETTGIHMDEALDALILKARSIVKREEDALKQADEPTDG